MAVTLALRVQKGRRCEKGGGVARAREEEELCSFKSTCSRVLHTLADRFNGERKKPPQHITAPVSRIYDLFRRRRRCGRSPSSV